MNRIALKHTVAFVVCAAAVLVVGYWGMAMSLATFAPGGDVTFSEAQKRRAATGDTILAVFDWPSHHVLGVQRSWIFSTACYGAALYGALVGSRGCLRKALKIHRSREGQ
jgi:hypothetical protein